MKTRTISIIIVTVAVLVSAGLYLTMQPRPPVRADAGRLLVMGTFARIIALAPDRSTAEKCIDAAVTEINAVDELMSDYKEDSEISQVNAGASDRPVRVSESTFEVLQKSLEFSKLTDGAFDVTVGPLVKLFRVARDTGKAPRPEQIAGAKAKVGYEKLVLNDEEKTIRFTVEGMSLDLGGIAKGYAIDRAIQAMKELGALGGLVDIGGDLRCFGRPPKSRDSWRVGLEDPNVDDFGRSGLLLKLKVHNEAVATSGDYRQFAIIAGERRSHILDRRTGKSAEGLSSVTIIAPDATTADALATAVSVLGPEKGLALIEKLPHIEAILISSAPEYKLTKTTGADKYIK